MNVDLSACTPTCRCVGPFRAVWVALGLGLFVFGMVYFAVTNTNPTSIITLKQRLIFTSPILRDYWTIGNQSVERFPIGDGFVAARIGDKAIIWGGVQVQPGGSLYLLPSDVVYSFMPDNQFGLWKAMEATGTIHPGTFFNGFAVLDSKIFIFGGHNGQNLTNALSTLDSNGHFDRLYPKGLIPSPRSVNQGFAYNGKFFSIGGHLTQIKSRKIESRKEDYIENKIYPGYFYTNEFVEYDPKTNAFTQLFIQGAHLSPRIAFALAVLGDRVFIHGGLTLRGTRYANLNDFYVLDMKSFKLTELKETGYLKGIDYHVAISLSKRHILFVGGFLSTGNSSEVTNQVKIFDAKKRQWKDEEPLSSEIGTGLVMHRATSFPGKKSFSILCLGGYSDYSWTLSSYMVLFNITLN